MREHDGTDEIVATRCRKDVAAIQEELLFLPLVMDGRDPVHERMLRPIATDVEWGKQRKACDWAATPCVNDTFGDCGEGIGP